MLDFEIICDLARLDAIAPAWESLLETASTNDPTLTPDWQLAWWRVFGSAEDRQLRVIAFHDAERLVAIAPLLLRRHRYPLGIPVRRVELVASGEARGDEICSEYNGVVVERGREAEVARALTAALSSGAVGAWEELRFPSMRGDGAMVDALVSALRADGHPAEAVVETTAPYIELPSTWDAYLRSIGSARRYLVKRTLRDVEAFGGGDVVLHRARTEEELERGFAILVELHEARWAAHEDGAEGGGVFASADFRAFHEDVMRRFLARGWLDLSWLSAGGQTIAALYNLRYGGKVYHYQSGRRVDLPRHLRPGIAIHAHAIRGAIEEGCHEYDFLGGESRYKDQLSTERRSLVGIRATRRPVVELALRLARRGLSSARAVGKQLTRWTSPRGAQAPVEAAEAR